MSSMRSFRKGLELLVVYIVLIIGIFVIQFRTDLNIIEKIGNLQITLTKLENSEDPSLLQNKIQVNYNGLNFHSDNQNSAKILMKDSMNVKDVELVSYSKPSDTKIVFNFTDNVVLNFEVTSDAEEASLSVAVELPDEISAFYIPYGLSYNLKVQKEEENRVILENKKFKWALTANKLTDGKVCLTNKDSIAHLAIYDDTKKFTIDMIAELAMANEETFNSNVTKLTNNMVSLFKTALKDGTYTEQEIASYIAARSAAGKYNEAIEEIPSSFKKGNKRTYLTTPFFNNLSDMNATLESEMKTNAKKVSDAAGSDNLDIFTTPNLASMLCIHENFDEATAILTRAAEAELEEAPISIITGIIQTYVELVSYESKYAEILEPALEKCFVKLELSSAIEDGKVVISDNGQFISVIQGVHTGIAVLRYGETISNPTYSKIGYEIINTYLQDASLDLKTISALYPLLSYNNWYYPHVKVINPDQKDFTWAWTCAKDITSSRDEKDNLTLVIDFPLEYTHYVIVKGITKFSSIYIYDVAFRTDPKFENYNSSGYVYRESSYTLLLKSRQKSQLETVRLVYNGLPSRKSAVKTSAKTTETKPAPKIAEKKYSVVLEAGSSSKKKAIIAELQAIRSDLSSREINKLYASAPTTIADNLTKKDADALVDRLTAAGATASRK